MILYGYKMASILAQKRKPLWWGNCENKTKQKPNYFNYENFVRKLWRLKGLFYKKWKIFIATKQLPMVFKNFLAILNINLLKIWKITKYFSLTLCESYSMRGTVQLISWIFSTQKTSKFTDSVYGLKESRYWNRYFWIFNYQRRISAKNRKFDFFHNDWCTSYVR